MKRIVLLDRFGSIVFKNRIFNKLFDENQYSVFEVTPVL